MAELTLSSAGTLPKHVLLCALYSLDINKKNDDVWLLRLASRAVLMALGYGITSRAAQLYGNIQCILANQ